MQRRSNLSSTGRPSALDRKDDRPSLRLAIRPDHNNSPPLSDSNSSSESENDEVDSETAVNRGDISPSVNTLLARSAQARKQSASTQARLLGRPDEKLPRPGNRSWRDSIRKDEEPARDRDIISSSRRKTSVTAEPEGRVSPYSRFLERRRSSVNSGVNSRDKSPEDNSYAARKNRIARSKSSHDLYPAEDSPEDDVLTAIRNRYRTRRNREQSPEETPPHSWSQYMKNKYGSGLVRSRTSASLALPKSDSENSSDEDTPPSRRRDYGRRGDSNSPRGFSLPRRTYMQKGKSCIKFGTRGTDNGCFTWPRGVCVGNDNTIVVADSNNHRVQVFTSSGKFLQQFGSYGSSEGEFDCLAGVTVNRIGQFIVSDRYNHRLQVFDPNGRFIRAFGCEGRMDGKFSYPWGVATDNLGFVYVCDKENHRIQVFQGDGTYVTKFGGIGQHFRRQWPAAVHFRYRGIRRGTVQVPQRSGRGRPRVPDRRRQRKQQNTGLPPRRDVPESLRHVGFWRRRVQRFRRNSSVSDGTDTGLRSRKPSHTSVLKNIREAAMLASDSRR
ncbi:RING finger protein nhl-1 [Caerostris extrusa]|uniref:RING finger protein nhl-1 n=1 Tax=Caerostris extrusa TaxID=172846 RepID=A0AAV4NDP1_CAEEX|nr:RING finger protein nhl-1 [Caerostris extrusa]